MKKTKAIKVREYAMKFPNATLNAIAVACNVSYAYACSIRGKMKKAKEGAVKEDWKGITIVSSDTSFNEMLNATPTTIDTVTGATPEQRAELAFQAGQNRPRMSTPKPLEGIDATLAERGSKYGKFTEHAAVTQALKNILQTHSNMLGKSFNPDQCEALDMICHKLGRIVNGDPDYADSWIDIAGYAKLVADRLESGKEV